MNRKPALQLHSNRHRSLGIGKDLFFWLTGEMFADFLKLFTRLLYADGDIAMPGVHFCSG